MPFVDLDPVALNAFTDRPKGVAVTPGAADVELGSDAPEELTFGSTLGAAFRQDNIVGSLVSRQDAFLPTDKEDGFDAWKKIKGTPLEQHWDSFVDIHNQRAFDRRLAQVTREDDDHRTLATAPWYKSVPAELAAGIFDPTNLLPVGYVMRAAKGGISIAKTAAMSGLLTGASATAQEAALHSMQQTRTGEESAVGIGTSVLLGTLLGAVGAKALSHVEWKNSIAAHDRALAGKAPTPDSPIARPDGMDHLRDYFAQQNAVLDKAEADLGQLKQDIATRPADSTPSVEGEVSAMPGEAGREQPSLQQQAEDAAKPFLRGNSFDKWLAQANYDNGLSDVARSVGIDVKPGRYKDEVINEIKSKIGYKEPVKERIYVDTRGKGERFHGTGMDIERLSDDIAYHPGHDNNYYGNGFYTTDAVDIGAGYTKKGGKNASLYKVDEAPAKLYDMEAPLSPDVQKIAEDAMGQHFPEERTEGGKIENLRQLFDTFRDESENNNLPKWEVQEIFGGIRDGLEKLGYRGFEHVGGLRTKNAPHNVRIFWFPEQDVKITKVDGDAYKLPVPQNLGEAGRAPALFDDIRPTPEQAAQEAPDLGAQTNFNAKPASVSSAAVLPADLEGNSIAGKAAAFLAYNSRFPTKGGLTQWNPLLRALHSPSSVVRDIMLKMVENTLYLNKNMEGVASEQAAETIMKQWDAGLVRSVEATSSAFSDYRKAGGKMTSLEFREAIGKAMRRGDVDADPHVDRVAKDWRKNVFDPMKEAAINANLLPEDVSVDTAVSYFSRMWNRQRLIAQEPKFKQIVKYWVNGSFPGWQAGFDRETAQGSAKLSGDKLRKYQTERMHERERLFGIEPGEVADTVANEVFNTLVGRTDGGARPELVTIKARGPLAERTFSIPDHLVEDFLVHDILGVGARYSRIMRADIELAKKFGSPDMTKQLEEVNAHYEQLSAQAKTEAERTALEVSRRADKTDIEGLRDDLRGTGNKITHEWERNFDHVSRLFRHYNYLRSMGEASLASLAESVRPAMVHGLMPFLSTAPKVALNLEGVKLSIEDAKLGGMLGERVLGHRVATLMEISDPYASKSATEAMLDNLTSIASVWNGIRLLTDMQKSFSSVLTQDRILKGVTNYKAIKKSERAYLAYLGIDERMAELIAKQYKAEGNITDGIRVAKTANWKDEFAKSAYYAAVNKDIDSIITTPGVADVPLFSKTPIGKSMLQFRSFALAAHQRVLLRGLQEDQARFIGGVIAMTVMGMFVTYLKAISGNRVEKLADFKDKPGWWIGEGIDRAGILAGAMEVANSFEKFSNFNPIKSPMQMFDAGGRRESQRIQNRNFTGTVAGPTLGLIEDASTIGQIPHAVIRGNRVSKAQKNAVERMVPFSSYPFVRQMLRYTVNPQN